MRERGDREKSEIDHEFVVNMTPQTEINPYPHLPGTNPYRILCMRCQ